MAKRKKHTKRGSGPHLAIAVFCEDVIEDKRDGALSPIRMVDQVTLTLPEGVTPGEAGIVVRGKALVGFKSGDAKGEVLLRLVAHSPSGESKQLVESPLPPFQGDEHGVNVRLDLEVEAREEGVYWFDVVLDRQVYTRMPLRVSFRTRPPETSGPKTK